MLQEVYNPSFCINLHLQITMNQWNTKRWVKTPMLMCLRKLRKITQDQYEYAEAQVNVLDEVP
jgi:hypothetical protein